MSYTSMVRRERQRNRTVLTAAAISALGAFALPADSRAADIHWGVVNGDWSVPANWVGGVIPGATDRAVIDFATAGSTAHATTDVTDVLGVSISKDNILKVETGGKVDTLASTDANNGIRIGDGSNGAATVTGDGHLATTGGDAGGNLVVGLALGTGTLTIDSAAALAEGNDVHIGGTNLPGNVASPGTGIVNISNGTLNARAWGFLGRDGGNGTINQTGGAVSFASGQFQAGFSGGTGTYNLSGGTFTAGNDVAFGNGAGTVGKMVQTGGTFTDAGGWSFIGRSGGTGDYKISGGNFNVAGQLNVGFQSGSTGTMEVMPGGTVTVGEEFTVGRDGGAIGIVTQTGGTVVSNRLMHVGRGGGNGDYEISAGTLNVGTTGGIDPDMVVGADFGTTGLLHQTGGDVNVARWAFVGRAGTSGGGTGTVNQSAGTFKTGGWLRISEAPGSNGTYNLSGTGVATIGGGDADTGDDDLIIGIDPFAIGTMNVSDSAVLNVARDVRLGIEGGEGHFNQTGGDVNVAGVFFVGTNPSGGGSPATGFASLSGGTTDVTVDLNVGESGNTTGTLDISATNITTVNGTLRAGNFGNGTVNQSGGTVNAGGVAIAANAGSAGDYNLSGGTLNALAMVNNGTFDASGTGVANLGPVDGTGATTVAGTAKIFATHLRQASLTMTGGKVKIAETTTGTAAGVSVLPALSITGPAQFDLTDNKIITNVGPGSATGGVYNGVQGLVQSGQNGGSWDGPGIITSKPAALASNTSIGVATGAQARGLGPADTDVWAGQTITGTSTLVMYTYAGDANLDGTINPDDYALITFNDNIPGASGWYNGDFNYDGDINADDFALIDFNFNAQGAPFFTSDSAGGFVVTSVPEPTLVGFAGAASLLLMRRRRSR